MKRFIAIILVIATMACMLTGCEEKQIAVSERRIKGLEITQYVDMIKGILTGIYAPQSKEDFDNVCSVFRQYANKAVCDKFSAVAPDYEKEEYSSSIVWKEAMFGDKRYQENNVDRLYYEFEVVRNYKHYKICVEFTLDTDGTISNYSVH